VRRVKCETSVTGVRG